MKVKKKIAGLLASVMILNSVSVLGNVQNRLPQDGISPVQVSHGVNERTGDIIPQAQVIFKEAVNTDDSGDSHNIYKPKAEYYNIVLDDEYGNRVASKQISSTGEATYNISLQDNLENTNLFRNGTLYKLRVIPGHDHKNERDEIIPAPLANGADPVVYFLTDFNTQMQEVDDEIVVTWESIPHATYKLVYIPKSTTTKAGVDGTDGSSTTGVSSRTVIIKDDDAETFTERGVKKVKYTIPNTAPGQAYSAYVVVDDIDTVGNSFLTTTFEKVAKSTNEPKIVQASRSVSLRVVNVGKNRIRLNWELGSWADNNTLKTTEIYRKLEGESSYTLIGVLNNAYLNPRDPGKFEHDEPAKKATYYVKFTFTTPRGDEYLKTKEVEYTPYELREKPQKPQVPQPFNSKLKENEDFRKEQYLVTGDDVAVEKMEDNTFHVVQKSPLNVQLVWDAPKLPDGKVDYDLYYDIWIVDDEKTLDETTLEPTANVKINESNKNDLVFKQDKETVVGFKTELTKYTDKSGTVKDMVSNKTYYIKMVAKRKYGSSFEESQPTVVGITIDKNGDIYTPPMISKPPLRVKKDGVTQDSITIEWLEKWCEIKAKDPTRYSSENDEDFLAKFWNSKVYTGGSPEIKFYGEDHLTEHILFTKSALDQVKSIVGQSTYNANYRDREVSLGADVKYEVKTYPYDDILKKIKEDADSNVQTIDKWIIENEESSTEGWSEITPKDGTSTDGLDWKEHTISGLEVNTRYVVLIRAYRQLESGEKLIQTYPNYVIATTGTDYVSPEETPTVPILYPNGTTDESVSVWWTYNENFDYKIVYSRLEDPNSATEWDFEFSSTPGESNYVSHGSKAVINITGLEPETTYNVWIKAIQKVGKKESDWSNPVTQTTLSIENPDPPRGLGPAAYQTILALGKDFQPIGKDYITVEWLKDVEDTETLSEQKVYSYVVEFADNPEFSDAITFNTTEAAIDGVEVLDKTTVRFTGLQANLPYYVRVKTVLTYTSKEGNKVIKRESEFTARVRILTKTSSGEYDGGENPNIVIYPEPVEESYKNGVWTYELVDAAKITTEILQKKDYYYTVTMNNYKGKYDAVTRSLKMPTKILQTLREQGMVLQIVTNIGTYQIPGEALSSYMNLYEGTDTVQFNLTRKAYSDIMNYVKPYPDQYQSGEVLEISFKGKTGTTKVTTLDKDMTVKLRMDVNGAYNYTNYVTSQYNFAEGNWKNYNYQVDTKDNKLLYYNTRNTGLNALYLRTINNSSNNTSYLMNTLASKYNIAGLGTNYLANSSVKSAQYVKLMLGIAQNSEAIDLTSGVTEEEYQKAKAAGLYISNTRGNVTREQALAGAVKLYEIKHGNKIKASNRNFSGVSSTYSEAVSKAYAVGMIDRMDSPRSNVKYSELCDWIALAIE